ncbi:MAG TPA: AAA family ATPase [Microbacterium sp.]|nr:AAA family ATPase [Microbacterium sp.]
MFVSGKLFGREIECRELDRLLDAARTGESGTLVLSGPPGIGKTALLGYARDRATGFRVESATGIESELVLAFAGLHQLCHTMLDKLSQLPEPQRSALSTALGLTGGTPPDRFLVGLAVLSLFSVVAEDEPLAVLVDDVQWLDPASAQVLAFVARRVRAESVVMLFAVRAEDRRTFLQGLTEQAVAPLNDEDAHALLDKALVAPVDAAVRRRIVADSRGCPLALLELSTGVTPGDLAGGFGLPSTTPLITSLEQTYISRLEPLPSSTRRLLLVAALESVGDVTAVWRAAESLGIEPAAAGPALSTALLDLDVTVRFRHPLVRSAIGRMAGLAATREAHRALADAMDVATQPDRRAWHLALAADGPDEAVAEELERSADRARERGGLAAAAAFLKATVALTENPELRAARAVTAAQAEYLAGASDDAVALLAIAESAPLSEQDAARASLLRGQIAFFSRRGREAPPLLTAAARRWEPLDLQVARDAHLDAVSAGLAVGRFAAGAGLDDVARAAQSAPSGTGRATDLLLDGFAALITEGYAAGAPTLARAVTAFRVDDRAESDEIRWLWAATHAARDLWDDLSWEVLSTRHIALARRSGALGVLPIALTARAGLHFAAGELAQAAVLVDEIEAVTAATARTTPPYGRIGLAAWQGDHAAYSALSHRAADAAEARGDGLGFAIMRYSGAVLFNSLGMYSQALDEATSGAAHPHDLCYAAWSQVEFIEAASRAGQTAQAAAVLEQLSLSTQASQTEWALGIEARSRALVVDDTAAEPLYREAIDRLSRTRVRMELARAHLLAGEWLRRIGRRRDARDDLRAAFEMFSDFGAVALAERARRELLATGETVRKRAHTDDPQLTPQESQIAALAAKGKTNPAIGAELFISARTVEWHLRKVYGKLGIATRKELADVLRRLPHGRTREPTAPLLSHRAF